MPETTGIHEIINPGGAGSSFSPAYSKLTAKPVAKKTKLKIGEIIPGRILEVQIPDIAVVQLPEGIFSAVLHSNLKKDDYIFFKVTETEPGLVLRIFSIPVKFEGKEISIEDCIRILDLPKNLFFSELITFLKKSRKSIIRDEIIKINHFYSNLPEGFKNYSKLQDSFNLILFLIDNKIQLTSSIYSFFSPLFLQSNNLPIILEKIAGDFSVISSNYSEELRNFINIIKKPEERLLDLFRIFILTHSDENKHSFYHLLTKILDDLEQKKESNDLKVAFNYLIHFIESLHIYNLINLKNKKQLALFIPYFKNNKYHIAKIFTNKIQKHPESKTDKVELLISSKKFENIIFNILKFDDIIEIEIKNQTVEIQKIIKELINCLSESLEKRKLKLGLVHIVELLSAEKTTKEQDEQKNQAISVVI